MLEDIPELGVLEFNLKLDGQHLAEREQVSVAVVPIMKAAGKGLKGVQSAMAAFPSQWLIVQRKGGQEDELSSVCLYALHSEMQNTEQLLGSLG